MATRTQADPSAVIPVSDADPTVIRPDVVLAYEALIADVPVAGGAGLESMLLQIAAAQDARELDAPWRSSGLEEWANQPLVIRALRRMPSEFEGGLPFFLLVDAAVRATGETVTVTTGAVSVVAQLAKAWSLGAIPGLVVVPRIASRPSARGYYPMHLEVVG